MTLPTTTQEREVHDHLLRMAEEQVVFLKQRYQMLPKDIIQLYGGQVAGSETYDDAVERIAMFNWCHAASTGFIAA